MQNKSCDQVLLLKNNNRVNKFERINYQILSQFSLENNEAMDIETSTTYQAISLKQNTLINEDYICATIS